MASGVWLRYTLIGCFLLATQFVLGEESSANSASTASSESTSRLSLPKIENKKFEENTEITDAKLKADAGSLSKFSLKFNLSYYGPTLGDLSVKDQPNPDGTIGTYETSLGGAMAARYRVDPKSSYSMGTGLKAIHPLHGMERFDVQTPYVSYDKAERIYDFQTRSSFGPSLTTIPNYKDVGQVGALTYDFSSVYDLGSSRVAVGLDANISLFLYNRQYRTSDRKASRGVVQLFPTLKYNFSNRLSINTSTALSWLAPRSVSNETVLWNKVVSQRLGLGYAFSRDIFIFPYLTLYPTKLAFDTTTMNVSTVFSIL
jgi:hypothetical protein